MDKVIVLRPQTERKPQKVIERDITNLQTDNTDSQEAIAELGTLVDENALTLEDVLNAIAELGAIVTADE